MEFHNKYCGYIFNNPRRLTKLYFDCDSIFGTGSGNKHFTA